MKAFETRKLKLQEELATSQATSEIAMQELKARVAKKKEILTRRWEYISELEAQLKKIKALLHATEGWAIATTTQAIKDYKKS